MRSIAWALCLVANSLLTSGRAPVGRVVDVSSGPELIEALRSPLDDVTIRLAAGNYVLRAVPRQDALLSCGEQREVRQATVGVVVSGHRVRLVGPEHGDAVIRADATYQILFDDCRDCEIESLTIAADVSDDMQYGGAAICATESVVRVAGCSIRDDGPVLRADAGPLKWVKGIYGRRGADLVIEFNEIAGNVVGIALHENAHAIINNNLIEGAGAIKAGGSAILVTCEADAMVERNHLRRFTNGIEISGNASLVSRTNIIEEIYADGIVATNPGLGRVLMEENVIYRCGSAGIAVRADGDQKASRNIVVETGTINPRASAIYIYGARAEAAMRKNTLYDNTVRDKALDKDAPREKFWRERRGWTRTYRNTPVGMDGRDKFHESAFLTRYGRWLH